MSKNDRTPLHVCAVILRILNTHTHTHTERERERERERESQSCPSCAGTTGPNNCVVVRSCILVKLQLVKSELMYSFYIRVAII